MRTTNTKTSTALLSVASNSLLIALKIVVGLLMGSVAVLSEAIHSGIDLVAAVIAFAAVRTSDRVADKEHPYGHGKVENISGTIEALLIFLAAIWIIYEAIRKLINPQEIEMPFWGVGVMLISAIMNMLVSRRLFKVGQASDSVALRADAWHLRTDVFTSLGVMLGLLVIWLGGVFWPHVNLQWLDPVIAIIVALLITKAAWDLTRESARDLLDAGLPESEVEWIQKYIMTTWPRIQGFHKLRTRKAGPYRFVDFHVLVDSKMSVGEAHAIGDEIVAGIKERVPGTRVDIHIEPCDHVCTGSCVVGCREKRLEKEAQRHKL